MQNGLLKGTFLSMFSEAMEIIHQNTTAHIYSSASTHHVDSESGYLFQTLPSKATWPESEII